MFWPNFVPISDTCYNTYLPTPYGEGFFKGGFISIETLESTISAPAINEANFTQKDSLASTENKSMSIGKGSLHFGPGFKVERGANFKATAGGQTTSEPSSKKRSYTGKEWDDEVGYYDCLAGWMDPVGGRFIGVDPVRGVEIGRAHV